MAAAVDRSATAHSADTLHRGEGQVIAGDRLGPRPGMLGDRGGQLPGILRLAAVLGGEESPCHLGADPGPIRSRHRPVPGSPAAWLKAAIRFATSTRNGDTSGW